jgi:hypothetical protein
MDKDKLMQFGELAEKIELLEQHVIQLKADIVATTADIKDLKAQKHTLIIELRPAFGLRPGPKAKAERKRRVKKVVTEAPES